MDIEHVAFTMEDPAAAAEWYARHLGLRIVHRGGPPANGRFLADSSGHVMMEIYNNPKVRVPDYRAMDPLILHVALEAPDVRAARERLLAAGASAVGDVDVTADGDLIAVVRDPWGFPIQLVHRAHPMI
jgi:catechol 2,3-dioxygenase-like lactoylglutathione lyase family enzyme